ncbi:C4-dicarboxylate ABC transporter permease [Thalassobaculum fulvum]|uniref:TRAP transporter large permease protein n=1 Tax=Thalassobaculum fulvum TaxID=1633335 RepID=A0A918XWC6_9PROT|nr:TRAP transporter large permease [Thalassobaculum fulvum]GHD61220.1 C4-dicarboxylate ABC transporter permease [Thalassobaculum fulvum]
MSHLEIGLWSFPVLLLLIFLRIPIGIAMFGVGVIGSIILNGTPLMMLAQLKHLPYGTFSNYSFSIIPLFLLMGQFATVGGLSTALFKAAEAWLGHRPGGVAMAAIGACAGFGAICGSSLATAATMGQVALPELRRFGCSGGLATGALAAGGTLGILIPPSVILVIYAILTEQNIAKLFTAALLPGALAAAGYLLAIAVVARVTGGAGEPAARMPYRERLLLMVRIWPVIVIFAAVIGGIYLGIFTPTEAAAVGAAGTGLVALLNGGLNRRSLRDCILATMSSTAMIFVIILGAAVFNTFLATTRLPQELSAFVTAQGFDPWLVLALVLLLYLVFGCVMDSLSMVLLTVPILFPVMSALDFGLTPEEFALWFGVLVLIVVEVGLITPPVGLNLFVINALARDVPIGETYRGVMPFVLTDLVRVAVLVVFPSLSLALVWLLY